MSKIFFHSAQDTIYLRGSERLHFNKLIRDIFWSAVNLRVLDIEKYFTKSKLYDDNIIVGDRNINSLALILNTVFATGSDSIKFATRLHGQCEIHCYVEDTDKAWLAKIIREGITEGVYEDIESWNGIVDFLHLTYGPVVLSYSVGEQFPDSYLDETDLNILSLPAQWVVALNKLRQKERSLRLNPNCWNEYYFGHGLDVYKLAKILSYPGFWQQEILDAYFTCQGSAQECWERIEEIYF